MSNTKKSIKVNAVMNVVLQVSTFIFPLISFPYISRVLLPEGTGKVNMAISFVAYFIMLAQLGLPTYGIIQCAKVRDNRNELSRIFNEIFTLNVIITALSYVILAILILTIPRLSNEKLLYFVVSLNVLLGTIGIEWLYHALEEYSYITIRSIVTKVIAVIAMFLLVKAKEDYVIYAAIGVFSSGLAYVFNLVRAREYVDMSPSSFANSIIHLKPALVFFAVACTATIYTNLDNVMLGFITTDTDVGYYSAAVKIKTILVSVITALGTVLLPRASYSVENGNIDEFNRVTNKAINLISLIAIPVAVYFVLFSKECILFIAGDAYGGAVLPMQIIMPTIIFIGFTNIIGYEILVPTGREKKVLYSTILGASVDVILNAILIPKYHATGAAIGTLVAELAVLVYQICILNMEERTAFQGIKYWKIILGTIVAGVATLFVKNTGLQLFYKLVLSAVAFFGIYGLINIKEILEMGLKGWKKSV